PVRAVYNRGHLARTGVQKRAFTGRRAASKNLQSRRRRGRTIRAYYGNRFLYPENKVCRGRKGNPSFRETERYSRRQFGGFGRKTDKSQGSRSRFQSIARCEIQHGSL